MLDVNKVISVPTATCIWLVKLIDVDVFDQIGVHRMGRRLTPTRIGSPRSVMVLVVVLPRLEGSQEGRTVGWRPCKFFVIPRPGMMGWVPDVRLIALHSWHSKWGCSRLSQV